MFLCWNLAHGTCQVGGKRGRWLLETHVSFIRMLLIKNLMTFVRMWSSAVRRAKTYYLKGKSCRRQHPRVWTTERGEDPRRCVPMQKYSDGVITRRMQSVINRWHWLKESVGIFAAAPHSGAPAVSFSCGVGARRPPGNQRHTLICTNIHMHTHTTPLLCPHCRGG